MKPFSTCAQTLFWSLVFLILAGVCSIPRFGQLENQNTWGGDSIYYLDMARVFAGDAPHFKEEYHPERGGAPFYNRPLTSFVAGCLGRYLLGGRMGAAFSIVNILAAAFIAVLLMRHIRHMRPDWNLYWLPSVLFLSGFPQLDWGYHILTDTTGLATAFGASYYAFWLMQKSEETPGWSWLRWGVHLLTLFALSALAFLARETCWLVVVAAACMAWTRRACRGQVLALCGLILVVVVLGKFPHSLYAHHYHVHGMGFSFSLGRLFAPRFVVDAFIKTLVSFNLAWFLAGLACLKTPRWGFSLFVRSWSVAAVLYMGAGYVLMSLLPGGYTPRVPYLLFPFLFILTAEAFDHCVPAQRRVPVLILYLCVQFAINLTGVMLDSGTPRVTIFTLLRQMMSH